MFGIGGTGDRIKNDAGWKENLSRIAEAHPSSALADRYGKKTTKEIKTREVLKKHKGDINSLVGEKPQHPRNEIGTCVVNPPLHRNDGKPIVPS